MAERTLMVLAAESARGDTLMLARSFGLLGSRSLAAIFPPIIVEDSEADDAQPDLVRGAL
jgi:hypothetical protein